MTCPLTGHSLMRGQRPPTRGHADLTFHLRGEAKLKSRLGRGKDGRQESGLLHLLYFRRPTRHYSFLTCRRRN